ncbi:MAG: hypothetical protein JW763_02310 [candidate division Zixibacteria bacterium]|nr:hypothetical protein [candidate division Zixibacteria bacterium]
MTQTESSNTSTAVRRKDHARQLLVEYDMSGLVEWATSSRNALRTMASLLFDNDPVIRWRAIEGIGLISGKIDQSDPDAVRRLLRRLFWLMNDESGGLCWHAPEAIGEILIHAPRFIDEFAFILLSFMHEEPFEAGVRWAVMRLAKHRDKNPQLEQMLSGRRDDLLRSLTAEQPAMRAYALMALQVMGEKIPSELREKLKNDTAVVEHYVYETGQLRNVRIADLAAE